MNSIGELSLTGSVGQYAKLTGQISAGNSLVGKLFGDTSVSGNVAVGTIIESESHTFVIVDEEGNEIPAVLVEDEITITATPNDIRLGATAITNNGVIVGEKIIPSYHTAEGYRTVTKGSRFTIPHVDYDYEKLQVVICRFDTNFEKSIAAIKVALEDNVYNVDSTAPLATVIKDETNTRIDLGITNDTGSICVIRYFMYKEIY